MTTDDLVTGGEFHFALADAALCAEHSCSRVFSTRGRSDDGAVRCPACGGSTWISLHTALGESAAATRAEIRERAEAMTAAINAALEKTGGAW